MKDGVCPKCGSREVYTKRVAGDFTVFVGLLDTTNPRGYICSTCSYLELYLDDEYAMSWIVYKWDRVDEQEKKKRDEL